MPSSTAMYTTGSTIRKLMSTARLALRTQSKARMMKLATGTALISCISGRISTRTGSSQALAAASTTPAASAPKKPARMRRALKPTRCQKAAVGRRPASVSRVSSGEASRNFWGIAMAANCQTATQNRMAAACLPRLFHSIVEVVARQRTAH